MVGSSDVPRFDRGQITRSAQTMEVHTAAAGADERSSRPNRRAQGTHKIARRSLAALRQERVMMSYRLLVPVPEDTGAHAIRVRPCASLPVAECAGACGLRVEVPEGVAMARGPSTRAPADMRSSDQPKRTSAEMALDQIRGGIVNQLAQRREVRSATVQMADDERAAPGPRGTRRTKRARRTSYQVGRVGRCASSVSTITGIAVIQAGLTVPTTPKISRRTGASVRRTNKQGSAVGLGLWWIRGRQCVGGGRGG
jgi:hypothetical protein